jgi:hypothetical protein
MVSRLESQKDSIQEGVESASVHAGRIMGIVATAVRDVSRELGEFATDVFEMREASARAEADRETAAPAPEAPPASADGPPAAGVEPAPVEVFEE